MTSGATTLEKPPVLPLLTTGIERDINNETEQTGGDHHSVIIPVENPRLFRHLGLLLALDASIDITSDRMELERVLHVRTDPRGRNMELKEYNRVTMDRQSKPFPHYAAVANGGEPLLNPSEMRYQPFILSPRECTQLYLRLASGSSPDSRDVLRHIYQLLGGGLEGFSYRHRKLIFPENYATTRLHSVKT